MQQHECHWQAKGLSITPTVQNGFLSPAEAPHDKDPSKAGSAGQGSIEQGYASKDGNKGCLGVDLVQKG